MGDGQVRGQSYPAIHAEATTGLECQTAHRPSLHTLCPCLISPVLHQSSSPERESTVRAACLALVASCCSEEAFQQAAAERERPQLHATAAPDGPKPKSTLLKGKLQVLSQTRLEPSTDYLPVPVTSPFTKCRGSAAFLGARHGSVGTVLPQCCPRLFPLHDATKFPTHERE